MEATHTKESGHWYRKDGSPAYTIIGKNGKERNTTLRDAKKEGLLPSVTTIIKCAAAPGLENWKAQQILMASLTTTRIENEPESAWIERIIADSQEQALKARERGTLIHAWVQGGFENEPLPDEAKIYFLAASETLIKEVGLQIWKCELPFATERYGGKVDLQTNDFIIDIKTTEKDLADIKTWPEHHMQLAAYSQGNGQKCGILYINYQADAKLIWITDEEKETGWKCFNALLDFYYAKSKLGGN